jgi:Cytochrome c3
VLHCIVVCVALFPERLCVLRYLSVVRLFTIGLAASGIFLFVEEAQAAAPSPPSSAGERPPAHPESPSLIPHTIAGRADCLACHGPAGEHATPENHDHRSNKMCRACHVPASSPNAPKPGERATVPVTNNYCLACHGTPSVALTLPDGEQLSLFVDQSVYEKSTHGRNQMPCIACHPSSTRYPHPKVAVRTHRELSRGIVQQSCFNCHEEVFNQFKDSVHGKALVEQGNFDVPGCPDCHGIHNISDPHGSLFRLESTDVCSRCHADPELAAKYGMSPNVVKTYLSDFHGASVRLTRKEGPEINSYKAVCYDCHGIHDIRKADDPNSHVVKEKLVETCQRCHPGADANFPAAWTSHYEPDRERWPIVYWVNLAYKFLIPSIIGLMLLYILLDLIRAVINRVKGVGHG